MPTKTSKANRLQQELILAGAIAPLPSDHLWFDGDLFSIYAASQPRSAWKEHTHEYVQIAVGVEPAHIHAEWRSAPSGRHAKQRIGNAVTLIPAGTPHQSFWQRRANLIHVYIHPTLLKRLSKEVLRKDSFELATTFLVRDPLIETIARELFAEFQADTIHAELAKAAVTMIGLHALRRYSAHPDDSMYLSGGLGPARERRIREYIEQHLDGDLSIKAMAQILDLSPQHFSTQFLRSTGFTPHQYVTHRRVSHAQKLLADASISFIDVALSSGFSSQSQLITTFRRIVGVTPGKFRMSIATR